MPRPPYVVGPSRCAISPVDFYPIRSPLVVSDFLIQHARGGQFCEIGTRHGDISACVAEAGIPVLSIEMEPEYCAALQQRDLNVLCRGIETLSPKDFASCSIYFWWPTFSTYQSEPWLRKLIEAHRALGTNATVFIAHDTVVGADMAMLPRLAHRYGANRRVQRIFFDEGGGLESGSWRTATASLEMPSYSHGVVGRNGHWGVFHLLQFELGAFKHLPPALSERHEGMLPRQRRPPGGVPYEPLRPGYCGTTSSEVTHCAVDNQGSITLKQAPHMLRTVDDCVQFCWDCLRCNFISFSEHEGDCSWFHDCDIDALKTEVSGFMTRRVSEKK